MQAKQPGFFHDVWFGCLIFSPHISVFYSDVICSWSTNAGIEQSFCSFSGCFLSCSICAFLLHSPFSLAGWPSQRTLTFSRPSRELFRRYILVLLDCQVIISEQGRFLTSWCFQIMHWVNTGLHEGLKSSASQAWHGQALCGILLLMQNQYPSLLMWRRPPTWLCLLVQPNNQCTQLFHHMACFIMPPTPSTANLKLPKHLWPNLDFEKY